MAAPRPRPPGLLDDPSTTSKWERTKQILWDSNLNAPIRGFYNLMNTPYETLAGGPSPEFDQAVGDSFDAAGGITVGSMPMPKPSNSLTMGIKAYHGSPHSFDKFSMDKIGTGEGAQAYGHGLYQAEKSDIGRGYRDSVMAAQGIDPEMKIGKTPINDFYSNMEQRLARMPAKQAEEGYNQLALMEDLAYGGDVLYIREKASQGAYSPQTMDWFEKNIAPQFNRKGTLYETEINADPNHFLDWDKPLSEQPEVQKRLATIGEAARSSTTKGVDKYISLENMLGAIDWPDNATPDVRAQYRNGAAARVSERLKEAGIPGIKYLDAGSRGKGVAYVQPMYKGQPYGDPVPAHAHNQIEQLTKRYKDMGYDVEVKDIGTRNYVVFDDKLIDIIKKYGIAGLLGGAGMYAHGQADTAKSGAY